MHEAQKGEGLGFSLSGRVESNVSPRMVRVCDFNPDSELHQIVCEIPKRLMHRRAITGNALHRILADHRADFFAVGVQVDMAAEAATGLARVAAGAVIGGTAGKIIAGSPAGTVVGGLLSSTPANPNEDQVLTERKRDNAAQVEQQIKQNASTDPMRSQPQPQTHKDPNK
jgi:hypothetical protein